MIIIHAYFKVDPKQRQEFLEHVKQVMAPSQAEEGNITYEFFEKPDQLNSFVFVEKWKDQEAIQVHEETAHFTSFVKDIECFLLEAIYVESFEASALNKDDERNDNE
ncbi:antibiotic biosynthesis monooxygenase [Peribacillus saganii]|uniref:Antibiotic biosynthesis monooxygenase n=1 Tax=Peribacillus saganii TaxID=2303992 RepID=A0A372LDY8_9BACI|nr:putative quinol monooxygenase [Peribacillus saganii]RFU64419.1 antibiotic biosynthesis monooxygenase [Peribacillus saganii]